MSNVQLNSVIFIQRAPGLAFHIWCRWSAMGCLLIFSEQTPCSDLAISVGYGDCAGPRKMDRVARWRQLQELWARDPFLRNGAAGGNKDGALLEFHLGPIYDLKRKNSAAKACFLTCFHSVLHT